MRKLSAFLLRLLSIGLAMAWIATAQQSHSTAPSSPPAPAAKTQKASAATARKGPAVKTQTPLALRTQKEKASYAIGLNIGRSMKRDSVEVDPSILARGIKDALAGSKALVTDEEAKAAIVTLQNGIREKQQQEFHAAGERNQKEGDAFLAANKGREGVVTLPSGLQYRILKEGTGPKPGATDTVVCNYRGTLLNSTEFDSSERHGGPATFPVNQVIKGWTEVLQLMPAGSKWQVVIPANLAYGERGAGADIGPNSTLVFDIELLSIQERTQNKAPEASKPN